MDQPFGENPQSPLPIDSPSFDAHACFLRLTSDSSLGSLISSASELISEIRDLDGQRQNLVYNHHHELVEASETIAKMKTSSEVLDATLDRLQTSFASVAELCTSLCSPQHTSSWPQPSTHSRSFVPATHLSPLLSLPTILKGLLTLENRGAADQLWGQWEPALRSFEEAGVAGAKEIGNECRDVLKTASKAHAPRDRPISRP